MAFPCFLWTASLSALGGGDWDAQHQGSLLLRRPESLQSRVRRPRVSRPLYLFPLSVVCPTSWFPREKEQEAGSRALGLVLGDGLVREDPREASEGAGNGRVEK